MNLPTQPKAASDEGLSLASSMVVSHQLRSNWHCAHPADEHDAWGCRLCVGPFPCVVDILTLRRNR